jgi:hypothetical protein
MVGHVLKYLRNKFTSKEAFFRLFEFIIAFQVANEESLLTSKYNLTRIRSSCYFVYIPRASQLTEFQVFERNRAFFVFNCNEVNESISLA